jgi:hypothetical protein
MPVSVQPNGTLRCSCGASRPLPSRADSLTCVIAGQEFARRHRCRTMRTQRPAPPPPDRWASLFTAVAKELYAVAP